MGNTLTRGRSERPHRELGPYEAAQARLRRFEVGLPILRARTRAHGWREGETRTSWPAWFEAAEAAVNQLRYDVQDYGPVGQVPDPRQPLLARIAALSALLNAVRLDYIPHFLISDYEAGVAAGGEEERRQLMRPMTPLEGFFDWRLGRPVGAAAPPPEGAQLQSILVHLTQHGRTEYLVEWDSGHETWEAESDLPRDVVEAYLAGNPIEFSDSEDDEEEGGEQQQHQRRQ